MESSASGWGKHVLDDQRVPWVGPNAAFYVVWSVSWSEAVLCDVTCQWLRLCKFMNGSLDSNSACNKVKSVCSAYFSNDKSLPTSWGKSRCNPFAARFLAVHPGTWCHAQQRLYVHGRLEAQQWLQPGSLWWVGGGVAELMYNLHSYPGGHFVHQPRRGQQRWLEKGVDWDPHDEAAYRLVKMFCSHGTHVLKFSPI